MRNTFKISGGYKKNLLIFLFFLSFSFFTFGFTLGEVNRILNAFRKVKQPIFFSHKIHIEVEELECQDCHKLAEKSRWAGIPKISECADCHSEPPDEFKYPQFKNEEAKVREYVKNNEEIPWVQVNKLPGHVYFSHKAHVVWAEMSCEDCHKGAKEKFEPYQKSDIAYLTMGKCMSCHEKKGASLDCITCH
jgi:hypothetical protein